MQAAAALTTPVSCSGWKKPAPDHTAQALLQFRDGHWPLMKCATYALRMVDPRLALCPAHELGCDFADRIHFSVKSTRK